MGTETPLHRLRGFLKEYPETRFIRLITSIYGGTQKIKTIPIFHALEAAAKSNVLRPGDEEALGLNVIPGSPTIWGEIPWIIDNYEAVDFRNLSGYELHFQIDWTSLRPAGDDPRDACVITSMYMTAPIDAEEPGPGYKHDARQILRKVLERAKRDHGFEILIGVEVEFTLFDRKDLSTPLASPHGLFGNENGLRGFEIVKEIVAHLEAAGVHVWSFHPEDHTDGEYELQTMPGSPLQVCDELAFITHTIKSIAQKNGCLATMMALPRVPGMASPPIVGRHVHMSINKVELADNFLAGLIEHMRGMTTVLCGATDAFQNRLIEPHQGGLIAWGDGKGHCLNRKALGRWEIRMADAQFNEHLQLATLIAAGMDGVAKQTPLSQPKPLPIKYTFPGSPRPPEEIIKEYNLIHDFPQTLGEALETYKADKKFYDDWLGESTSSIIYAFQENQWAKRETGDPAAKRSTLLENI